MQRFIRAGAFIVLFFFPTLAFAVQEAGQCQQENSSCVQRCELLHPPSLEEKDHADCLDQCRQSLTSCCVDNYSGCSLGCRFFPSPNCQQQCEEALTQCSSSTPPQSDPPFTLPGLEKPISFPTILPPITIEPVDPLPKPTEPGIFDQLRDTICGCLGADGVWSDPSGGGVFYGTENCTLNLGLSCGDNGIGFCCQLRLQF